MLVYIPIAFTITFRHIQIFQKNCVILLKLCKCYRSHSLVVCVVQKSTQSLAAGLSSHSLRCHGIICPYLSASARSFYTTLVENDVLPVNGSLC